MEWPTAGLSLHPLAPELRATSVEGQGSAKAMKRSAASSSSDTRSSKVQEMIQQMTVQQSLLAEILQQMKVQQSMLATVVQQLAGQLYQTQGQLNTQTTAVTDLAAAMASMAREMAALKSAGMPASQEEETETEPSVPTIQPTIPYSRPGAA